MQIHTRTYLILINSRDNEIMHCTSYIYRLVYMDDVEG
jgi:hypothetical protein